MMNSGNLYINTIRICIRANKYTFGDTLLYKIRSQSVYLVLTATDAGASSSKKIIDKCSYYDIECYKVLSKEDMKLLFGKEISSFGITDKNLALKLKENLVKGGIINGK